MVENLKLFDELAADNVVMLTNFALWSLALNGKTTRQIAEMITENVQPMSHQTISKRIRVAKKHYGDFLIPIISIFVHLVDEKALVQFVRSLKRSIEADKPVKTPSNENNHSIL